MTNPLNTPPLRTVQDVKDYIRRHELFFGHPPYAVGLQYQDYINILAEAQGDGRCTNIQAHIGNVRLVRL